MRTQGLRRLTMGDKKWNERSYFSNSPGECFEQSKAPLHGLTKAHCESQQDGWALCSNSTVSVEQQSRIDANSFKHKNFFLKYLQESMRSKDKRYRPEDALCSIQCKLTSSLKMTIVCFSYKRWNISFCRNLWKKIDAIHICHQLLRLNSCRWFSVWVNVVDDFLLLETGTEVVFVNVCFLSY